jgi:hypothetical protein
MKPNPTGGLNISDRSHFAKREDVQTTRVPVVEEINLLFRITDAISPTPAEQFGEGLKNQFD